MTMRDIGLARAGFADPIRRFHSCKSRQQLGLELPKGSSPISSRNHGRGRRVDCPPGLLDLAVKAPFGLVGRKKFRFEQFLGRLGQLNFERKDTRAVAEFVDAAGEDGLARAGSGRAEQDAGGRERARLQSRPGKLPSGQVRWIQ